MKTTILSISLCAIVAFFSFTKPKKPITTLEDMKKAMKIGYSYVPTGNILLENDTVIVQGFFMYKNEVSNFDYMEFLYSLKLSGKTIEYTAALPDTSAWKSNIPFSDKYVEYYFRHPAYRNYPVVNLTKAQAEKYCEWLTTVWRKNTRNESIIFRLPLQAEFLKATYGNTMERPYSWNSPYLMDAKGQAKCNFLNLGPGAIARDPETGKLVVQTKELYFSNEFEYSDLTAPSNSFYPNEFGIYHLNGNVSEIVAEEAIAVGGDWNSPGYDIRNQSTKAFTKANPTVGFRPVMTFIETKK